MPENKETKTNLSKLNAKQVESLKGKLVEIRRVGATPIFIEVEKSDSIKRCLKNADVPTDENADGEKLELKIEAMKDGSSSWESVGLNTKAIGYQRIVVTTKVRGSY